MEKCDTKDRCPKENNNKRKCVKMLDSSVGALDHDVQKKMLPKMLKFCTSFDIMHNCLSNVCSDLNLNAIMSKLLGRNGRLGNFHLPRQNVFILLWPDAMEVIWFASKCTKHCDFLKCLQIVYFQCCQSVDDDDDDYDGELRLYGAFHRYRGKREREWRGRGCRCETRTNPHN